jgi:diacylglycerol kinase (ATP)
MTKQGKSAMMRAPEDMKTAGETPVQHFFRAAGYSLSGLGSAWQQEMAFRMEVVSFAVLLPVAILLPVPLWMRMLVIASMLLVLVVELLNSAVEWVVDYVSLERHPFAKRAKDMGSAAVLLTLLHSGMFWAMALAVWAGWLSAH